MGIPFVRLKIYVDVPFKFHSRLSAFLERTKSTSHIDYSTNVSLVCLLAKTRLYLKRFVLQLNTFLCDITKKEKRAHRSQPIKFVLQLTSAATRATVETCHARTLRFFRRIRIQLLQYENES